MGKGGRGHFSGSSSFGSISSKSSISSKVLPSPPQSPAITKRSGSSTFHSPSSGSSFFFFWGGGHSSGSPSSNSITPTGISPSLHFTNTTSNSLFDHSIESLNISSLAKMHMTNQQRLDEARSLAWTLDKLSRSPKNFSPSAPIIIPILMVVVALFAVICLVIKIFMNYLNSKNKKTQKFGIGEPCSPDLPTTPEVDQTSLATTASMKTRGSLRLQTARRNKLPPVSLYQMKQKQSPRASTTTKLRSKGAMRAMAKASKADPNRSSSRDSARQDDDNSDLNINNDGGDSPTNLSQRSFDSDEIQATNMGIVYAADTSGTKHDDIDGPHQSTSHQPEVHIVQIRELEDNVQHSQYPQTESEI